jgi:hypothetical protein
MERLQGVTFIQPYPLVLLAVLALPALAQSTCYTNPQGTTICSNAGSVIHGNTNSAGNSVYRDDRGNRLDFETDSAGNASVQPEQGEAIRWSQPVLGEQKYPVSTSPAPPSPPIVIPGRPESTHLPRAVPQVTEPFSGSR